MTFEEALRDYLEGKPRLTRDERRILSLLNDPRPGIIGRRRIAALKREAKAALKLRGIAIGDDWSGVGFGDLDWKSILEMLLKFLIALLPFVFNDAPRSARPGRRARVRS